MIDESNILIQSTGDTECIEKFVDLGGGKHLVRLFMSIENDTSNSAGQRTAFAYLLRIMNALALSYSKQNLKHYDLSFDSSLPNRKRKRKN